jgi:hypothetical protein
VADGMLFFVGTTNPAQIAQGLILGGGVTKGFFSLLFILQVLFP